MYRGRSTRNCMRIANVAQSSVRAQTAGVPTGNRRDGAKTTQVVEQGLPLVVF